MKETTKFEKWVERVRPRRGLICHFYIPESDKQYYDKLDYALFNLNSCAKEWIVKGTSGHGIRSRSGKSSRIPCLNCFEVNAIFTDALDELQIIDNHKFEFGIIFNKRYLQKYFGWNKVINVVAKIPNPRPVPNECHRFDHPYKKYGALKPFHWCQVVRIEIDKSDLRSIPIVAIPGKAIMGFLARNGDVSAVKELLESKKMGDISVFPVL